MSATSSTRWFFSDWLSDPGLRMCSLSARGLWIDLLCIMGSNAGSNYGYLRIGAKPIQLGVIAKLVQATSQEVRALLNELESNEVFSRTRHGTIYSRRMVRQQKNRANGLLGGNPNLLKVKDTQDPVNQSPNPHIPYPLPIPSIVDRGQHDADSTQSKKPTHAPTKKAARGQPSKQASSKRAPRAPMPDNWQPSEAGLQYATDIGIARAKTPYLIKRCRDYHIRNGTMIAGERGLAATWRTWCDNEVKFDREKNGSAVEIEPEVDYAQITKGMTPEQKKAFVQEEMRKFREANRVV